MLLNQEEVNKRLAVCDTCPFVTGSKIPICTKCGCLILIKSRFSFFHCPLLKWDKDTDKEDFIRYEHKCNSCGHK